MQLIEKVTNKQLQKKKKLFYAPDLFYGSDWQKLQPSFTKQQIEIHDTW